MTREASWNFKTGEQREVIVISFPKAKRSDGGKYGFKSAYASASYAPVKFCPFCGKEQDDGG